MYNTDLKARINQLEQEKEDLESEVRNERNKISSYCLLDEKLNLTLEGLECELMKVQHGCVQTIKNTLNLVENSIGLKEIVTMSRREQARLLIKQIDDLTDVQSLND